MDRLDSWKAIASYLKRDVRTVQRWEAQLSLPVHRLRGDKGGSVYAYKEELDAWWQERGQLPATMAEQPSGSKRRQESERATESHGQPTSTTSNSTGPKRWRIFAAAAVLCAALLLALVLLWSGPPIQRASARGKIKLVVLPFENLGGDPAKEYFSDGMTEEMIALLSEIQPEHLGVIARASSMTYKNTQKDLKQICSELGVDYVLEGGVLLVSGRARINTQLTQCSDQTQAWAGTSERDLANVLALQNSVAQSVAANVRVLLDPPVHSPSSGQHPVDPEAYEAYLKGLYMFEKLSPEANRTAIEFFQSAIRTDPGFARAYSGLAYCDVLEGALGGEAPQRPFSDAKNAAAKALNLDETQAEAHSVLADVAMEYDWDWAASEREFRRALDLNPNLVITHLGYYRLLLLLHRSGEAAAQLNSARTLDPVSNITGEQIIEDLNFSRHYDEAIAKAGEFLNLHPDSMLAQFYLADAYYHKGLFSMAIETYLKAMLARGEDRLRVDMLREAGRRDGILGFWRKKLELDMNPGTGRYVRAYDVAYDYAALGDRDHSFKWLDKSVKAKDGSALELGLQPVFDVLRSDPRFTQLLQSMKLQQ